MVEIVKFGRLCGWVGSRDHQVGVFNFRTDRVRVLKKTSGSGSGTDRVRVLALHFYHSGINGYRKSWEFFGYIPDKVLSFGSTKVLDARLSYISGPNIYWL